VAFMGALRNLGVEVVLPSRVTNRAVELGVPRAPEFVCLPFKMTLGNFIEALEQGADTIVMIGGRGPCRLGFYSHVQEQILRDLGYEFEIIRTDNPDALRNILGTMKEVSGVRSPWRLIGNFYFIMRRLVVLEELGALANRVRPFERHKGDTEDVLERMMVEVDATRNLWELSRARRRMRRAFARIPVAPREDALRIGLVGEIFMVLEPFANMAVERRLGEMGVLVERGVSLADWFNERVHFAPWRRNQTRHAARLARGYLQENAGGESLLSVGRAIEYARRGFDGMVHVMPLGCMPEMVAQSALTRVSRELGLPVLHLIFDEHSTELGVVTRLEAFVDMLERKKCCPA